MSYLIVFQEMSPKEYDDPLCIFFFLNFLGCREYFEKNEMVLESSDRFSDMEVLTIKHGYVHQKFLISCPDMIRVLCYVCRMDPKI
jgi:hypothetical protein